MTLTHALPRCGTDYVAASGPTGLVTSGAAMLSGLSEPVRWIADPYANRRAAENAAQQSGNQS